MITVQVFYKYDGKPAKDKKVSLLFSGFFTGGASDTKYTDSNGEAHFNNNNGEGQVYVENDIEHQGQLAGRIIVYI